MNLQLFEILFFFSGLMTLQHPEKLGSFQSCARVLAGFHKRFMWGRGPGFPLPLLLTVTSISASVSCMPYQNFWSDLSQNIAFFYLPPKWGWGEEEDACGSKGIMSLISKLLESNVHHQWDCKSCCTFLKILLGVWVVGENFQVTAAYIRNCPPLPCFLWGLTHSPSLLFVLCQDISAQAFKISTLYLPLPLLNAAAEREKVW